MCKSGDKHEPEKRSAVRRVDGRRTGLEWDKRDKRAWVTYYLGKMKARATAGRNGTWQHDKLSRDNGKHLTVRSAELIHLRVQSYHTTCGKRNLECNSHDGMHFGASFSKSLL